jgi:hypothetical protein
MTPKNRVEAPPDISVYHLSNLTGLKEVEDFINDPKIARPSISQTRSSMRRREIKHVVEEVSIDDRSESRLCI